MFRTPWILSCCLHRSHLSVYKPGNSFLQAHILRELSGKQHAQSHATGSTVDQADVDRHTKLLKDWWDPNGPMKALHSYNLVRIPFIREGLTPKTSAEKKMSRKPLAGFNILDVGCGGGILSEPLFMLGAEVTGLDASPELIQLAKEHSEIQPKIRFSSRKPTYICSTIEDHANANAETYDAVVASEIIEHVNDKELFVRSCIHTLKPGGRIFFTTPNRTTASKLLVINAAENIFKVVPKGTHQIDKFTTPNELAFMLERNGCHVEHVEGLFYSLMNNKWYWTSFQKLIFAMQAIKLPNPPI